MAIERSYGAFLALCLCGSILAQEKVERPASDQKREKSAKSARSKPSVGTAKKPIRVLYVEDVPRWEYRYLKNGLLRAGPGIRVQTWLLNASDDYRHEHSKGEPRLTSLPSSAKALANYDVILIGDVRRKALGKTAKEQAAWCKLVVQFVQDGGGVALLAGELDMPDGYRGLFDQTLLPVILEPPWRKADGRTRVGTQGTHSFRVAPVLNAKRELHPILRVGGTTKASLAIWARREGLRRYVPVRKLKRGARAILRRPKDKADRSRVIAAIGEWGKGRTFFIASGETWLWRKGDGERVQDTFWRNVVRHLAGR